MQRVTLPVPAASVASLAWLPDSAAFLLGRDDGAVALWSLAARHERDRLAAHEGPVTALAVAPSGTHLATGGRDGRVRVWDLAPVVDGLLARAVCLATHTLRAPVRALAWSRSGRSLAAADERGAVLGLDLDDPAAAAFALRRPAGDARHLLWSHDSALWGGGDGVTLLWLRGRDDLERHRLRPDGRVLGLADSPEERLTLVALDTGVVRDSPYESDRVLADAGRPVTCWASACARAYTLMFYGTPAGTIDVLLHERGAAATAAFASFAAHRGPVAALACAPDGFGLVSVGDDGDVHLWLQGDADTIDAPDKKPYERWCGVTRSDAGAIALTGGLTIGVLGEPHRISVTDDPDWGGYGAIAWAPAGDALIAVDDERADLRRHDLRGAQLDRRRLERSFAGGLAVARDGTIAVATRGGGISLFDAAFAPLADLASPHDVAALAWSPDGVLLAALDDGRRLVVLADRGARPILTLDTAAWSGQRHTLAWSPDGALLAVGGDALLLVDLAAGAVARRHACALSPAFSPDGRWLASCTPPQTIVVRDVRDDRPVAWWQRNTATTAGTDPLLLAWRDAHTLLVVEEHRVLAWTIAALA